MTLPAAGPTPRRRMHLLWWVLGVVVVATLTGLVGGIGVARLTPSSPDPAATSRAAPTVPAPSPAAEPTEDLPVTACLRGFDIFDAMQDEYAGGADFAESRSTAAERLRLLAGLYPDPDRTYLIDFSDVLAASAQISGEDRAAVTEARDREGDAWLEFVRFAC